MACDHPFAPGRRRAIAVLGSLGAAGVLGLSAGRARGAAAAACTVIPPETAGPFPLPAILREPAFLRSNITEGQTGVVLELRLTVVDASRGCAPVPGAAVYVWHCNKDGAYSGYRMGPAGDHRGESWLRGLQITDAAGLARFRTIYPGWYPGRITHIHFQVYRGDRREGPALATSQLAFPQDITRAVYASPAYAAHGQNNTVGSIADDGIFADGYADQVVTIGGDPASGYVASLQVGIAG